MFNDLKQCGTRCKELGPMVAMSIRPAAMYMDTIHQKLKFTVSRYVCENVSTSIW